MRARHGCWRQEKVVYKILCTTTPGPAPKMTKNKQYCLMGGGGGGKRIHWYTSYDIRGLVDSNSQRSGILSRPCNRSTVNDEETGNHKNSVLSGQTRVLLMVLASLGAFLDTQTLKKNPSGHPIFFVWNFRKSQAYN